MSVSTANLAPAPPPAKPGARIEGADGLRGLAALLVVAHHIFDGCNMPEWRVHRINVLRPVNEWWFSVDMFLVLSGFCLFLPYAGNVNRKFDYIDFMRRRLLRIMPAYYASLIIVTILYRIISVAFHIHDVCLPNGPLDVALHLMLLQTLDIHTFWSWTGAAWNLGLEWTWYLVFFLPVLLFRRAGPWTAIAIMSAVTLIYMAGVRHVVGPMSSMEPVKWMVLTDTVPGRLMEFGLGMLAAWWLANRPISGRMITAAYVLVPLGMVLGELRPPIDYGIRPLTYALTFTVLLLAAAAPRRNLFRDFFSLRPLRWVGECSYSLYLFHLPFVTLTCTILLRVTHSERNSFLLALFSIPLIVLIAHGSYLIFERPFMRSKPVKPSAAPAALPAT